MNGKKTHTVSKAHQLEVSKAIEQADFISRSYELNVWGSAAKKDVWKHDLAIMRSFNDLKSIRLQLICADDTVLFEMRVDFRNDDAHSKSAMDSAEGVELPLLDQRRVVRHRMIVDRGTVNPDYERHLKMNWKVAAKLKRRPGRSFRSEHAAKITAGRLSGQFHVDGGSCRRLRVYQTGTRGFSFAETIDGEPLTGVFCHEKFAAPGVCFVPGSIVQAIVIQTPRGLQARSIQAA